MNFSSSVILSALLISIAPAAVHAEETARAVIRVSAVVPQICHATPRGARLEGDALIVKIDRMCNSGHVLTVSAPPTLEGLPVTVTEARTGRVAPIATARFVSDDPLQGADEIVIRAEGADAATLASYARHVSIRASAA